MSKRDYYEILNIKKDATDKEIKNSYRKLAKKYHPDSNPDSKACEERFKEVTEAYDILSDPEKRKLYDRFGHAAFDGSMGDDPEKYARQYGSGAGTRFRSSSGNGFTEYHFENGDADDILRQIFGSFTDFGGMNFTGTGAGRSGMNRAADYTSEITVSFREAALGCEKIIRFDDGQIGTLKVKVPAGISEGQSIRLKGKGQRSAGTSGDLLLKVHINADDYYTRDGLDVYITQNIPVWTAALGGEAQFETLYGKVNCTIPPGSQSGRKIRLKNKGIVSMKDGSIYGDEYVILNVQVPTGLTEREKELLRELQKIEKNKRRSSVA